MSNKLIKTDLAKKLRWAIQEGVAAWTKAGEMVVQLMDEHGMGAAEIAAVAGADVVSAEVVLQFERIGRRQVSPNLLVAPWPAARKMERLSYSQQQELMRDGVELAVRREDDWDVVRVPVKELTAKQVKQVFLRDGIRTAGQQRLFIEEVTAEAGAREVVKQAKPWTVRKHEVVVLKPCALTRTDLLAMLGQI